MEDRLQEYYERVGNRPNSLVVQAVKETVARQAALDLGAGNLRDSKYMLSQGFSRVVAVDNNPDSRKFWVDGIELHIANIETGNILSESFDLIVCCNTFFFIEPQVLPKIFEDISRGLRSGGIFACNVLGKNDQWVLEGNQSYFTREEILLLSAEFTVIRLEETRTTNTKNWHLWSLLVRKP